MDIASIIEQFVQGIGSSNRPIPDPSSIQSFSPDLSCLGPNPIFVKDGKAQASRDDNGLVMQLQEDFLTHPETKLRDGGDSAHRTGVLAFCGSAQDKENLPRYLIDLGDGGALGRRHPSDVPWNNPWNFTRDQLIGYLAGVWRSGQYGLAQSLYKTHSERNPPFTAQSKEKDYPGTLKPEGIGDLLGPDHIMFFKICCGDYSAALDVLGQTTLFINIQLAPTGLEDEINQPLLMSIVCGQLDVFVKAHPNYREVLRQYWGRMEAFRYQPCIAEAMIDVIELELTRYKPPSLIDWLIPKHLLEELKGINIEAAIRNGQIINPAWYAEISVRLAIALLKDIGDRLKMFANAAETGFLVSAEVQIILLKAGKHLVNEVKGICNRGDLKALGPLVAPVLNAAAGILGLFAGDNDDTEEIEFRAVVRRDLATILSNSNEILNDIKDINAKLVELLPDCAAMFKETVSNGFEIEHLNTLRDRLVSCVPYLAAFEMDPTPERMDGLRRFAGEFDDAATRLLQSKFNAATLPFAIQAFQGLTLVLSTIEDRILLAEMCKSYKRQFTDSYYLPLGLCAQMRSLRLKMDTGKKTFDSMLGPQLLVTRMIQQYEEKKVSVLSLGKVAGGKVPLPSFKSVSVTFLAPKATYDHQYHTSHFSGTIGALDSITFGNEPKEPEALSILEGGLEEFLQQNKNLLKIWPPTASPFFKDVTIMATYVQAGGNPYPSGLHENDYVEVRTKHLDKLVELSGKWTEAKNALRTLETLATSATAIFGIDLLQAPPTPLVTESAPG